MDIYQIENEIRNYESDIERNNEKILKLKIRIEELKKIAENLTRKQEDFEVYQNSKRMNYENMRNNLKYMKFAVQCSEDMLTYINGQEAQNARNAFIYSKDLVIRQISAKEEEIEDLERENRYLRNLIYDLEAEKKVLEQNGGE